MFNFSNFISKIIPIVEFSLAPKFFVPPLLATISVFLGYIAKGQKLDLSRFIKIIFFFSIFFSSFLFSQLMWTYIIETTEKVFFINDSYLLFLPCFIGAYLLGSLPFGLLFSRLTNLPDPRTIGSGNIGATNVLRSGKKLTALATLLADGAKGMLAIIIFDYTAYTFTPDPSRSLLGLLAIIGHIFPVWLGYKGGKGVATALGVYAVLFGPMGFFILLGIWVLSAVIFRYSSLSSLIMVFAAVPLSLYYEQNILVFLLIAILIIFRHKENLLRLYQCREDQISFLGKKV